MNRQLPLSDEKIVLVPSICTTDENQCILYYNNHLTFHIKAEQERRI
jgi:hypothetical protein